MLRVCECAEVVDFIEVLERLDKGWSPPRAVVASRDLSPPKPAAVRETKKPIGPYHFFQTPLSSPLPSLLICVLGRFLNEACPFRSSL